MTSAAISISIPRFLSGLREKGFSVSLAGDGLQFKGGTLTDDEKRQLQSRQSEILLFLKAHKATSMPRIAAGAPRPSQSQKSWWRWIRQSPVQLSHERIPVIREYSGVTLAQAREALEQMVLRHAVLRSHFRESGGRLSLTLLPAEDFAAEIEQAPAHLSAKDAKAHANSRAREFVSQNLPVDGPRLFRAKIIAAGPDQVTVALLFAHMIVDGLSSQLLSAELDTRLTGSAEAKAALTEPPAQFLDYTESEHAWLQGPQGAALTDYWLQWLGRQSDLRAPATGETLSWQPGLNVSHAFTIPGALRDGVQALAARYRSSPSSVFLALYAMALARWSGQSHFPIRVVGNLRRTPAQASTVGFMVCIDPVEIQIPPDAEFAALLKSLATEYYNAAMLRLPGFLEFPAQAAHPGVEQIMLAGAIAATFNYMPAPRQADKPAAAKIAIWPPPIENTTREPWAALLWPVYLRLADVDENTLGLFQFNEAIVTPADQAALMAQFFAVLAEMAPA